MHQAKWTLKHKNIEYIHANTVYYTYTSDTENSVVMLVDDLLEAGVCIIKIMCESETDTESAHVGHSLSADSFLQQYYQLKKTYGIPMDYTIFCELNEVPFAVSMSDLQPEETNNRIVISSDSFCFDVNHLLSKMEKLNSTI